MLILQRYAWLWLIDSSVVVYSLPPGKPNEKIILNILFSYIYSDFLGLCLWKFCWKWMQASSWSGNGVSHKECGFFLYFMSFLLAILLLPPTAILLHPVLYHNPEHEIGTVRGGFKMRQSLGQVRALPSLPFMNYLVWGIFLFCWPWVFSSVIEITSLF